LAGIAPGLSEITGQRAEYGALGHSTTRQFFFSFECLTQRIGLDRTIFSGRLSVHAAAIHDGCAGGREHANHSRDVVPLREECPIRSIASIGVREAVEAIVAREGRVARTELDGAICSKQKMPIPLAFWPSSCDKSASAPAEDHFQSSRKMGTDYPVMLRTLPLTKIMEGRTAVKRRKSFEEFHLMATHSPAGDSQKTSEVTRLPLATVRDTDKAKWIGEA